MGFGPLRGVHATRRHFSRTRRSSVQYSEIRRQQRPSRFPSRSHRPRPSRCLLTSLVKSLCTSSPPQEPSIIEVSKTFIRTPTPCRVAQCYNLLLAQPPFPLIQTSFMYGPSPWIITAAPPAPFRAAQFIVVIQMVMEIGRCDVR